MKQLLHCKQCPFSKWIWQKVCDVSFWTLLELSWQYTICLYAIVRKWELDKRMDCEAQSVAITVPAITIFSWHISDTTRPKFDNLCSFGFSVSSHNSWLNQTLLKRGTRIFHINQKLKTFKKLVYLAWLRSRESSFYYSHSEIFFSHLRKDNAEVKV